MSSALLNLKDKNSSLPNSFKTKAGATILPYESVWNISDGVKKSRFNFGDLDIDDGMLDSFKFVLLWYLEYESLSHAKNLFERFAHFVKFLNRNVSQVNENDILNYKAHLAERREWYLGALAGLFKKWRHMLLPGISDGAYSLLKELRIKGNLKGEAVLTMDPNNGPFTELETQSIHRSLARLFEAETLAEEEYCLAWLFLAFGMRPIQYAGMKICDVWKFSEDDGSEVYVVRIPRAKQRVCSRELFLERKVPSRIGKILASHILNTKNLLKNKLTDVNEAPLFPAKETQGDWLSGFELHETTDNIAKRLKRIIDSLDVVSERTGKKINVTATRFRRTVGTRAAEEGHGALIIAEILDHKDTQNVGVYVEATPAIVDRIDKALALKIAPLAQAFKGLLIKTESEAERGNDPDSRIVGPKQTGSFKPVGSCGSYGFCGQLAPVSCYTCSNFQPWLDGPHEKVLEHLIKERSRLLESSTSRVAAINDQTILAAAQVVAMCQRQLGSKNE